MFEKSFELLYVTNLPSFYKIRLLNEISKQVRIYVVFLDKNRTDRNEDFYNEEISFDYSFYKGGTIRKCLSLIKEVLIHRYKKIIVGGWDRMPFLILPFFSPKNKNGMICESSIYEYRPSILKDSIKRLFLSRISTVYPSGKANRKIFDILDYHGKINCTGGCGILNYVEQPHFKPRDAVKRFLFVGRLIEEKNLKMLIHVFNEFPELNLTIIGFGEQEKELKKMADNNIRFMDAIENKKLPCYYQEADVFILPSKSETWGLVVEEALNNGTPVIVSDHVGCHLDLVTEQTGLVFKSGDENSLKEAILKMCDVDYYNTLRKGVSKLDFQARAKRQVDTFIDNAHN